MKRTSILSISPKRLFFVLLCVTVLFTLIITPSCNFLSDDDDDDDVTLDQTQVALSVEQTLAAQEGGSVVATLPPQEGGAAATIAAQQATIQALDALATAQAQQIQQPPVQQPQQPVQQPQQPVQQPQQPVQQPQPAGNINELMKTAQILLFEDIVNDVTETRYVKKTLDAMDLRYKDDGSAKGWLKNDLLAGSPSGKPWDLVILAIEARGGVSGEYFDYLDNVLDQGASVILEAWHLDAISQGKVSPLLADCGVQIYPYFPKTFSVNDVLLWPLPSASQHPVMHDPNGGLTFTKARTKWIPSMDLGSLMALTGRKDAVFLIGRDAQNEYKDGALVVCMGGRLILQTFSSHSFPWDTMYPLWENYINNALRVRFSGG